ncbi:hypothetical protein F4809DRAFT_604231 [Biscogniauxia mediterranea]|nr:hypothetical protein F4809DRAFT_604231 [Biscogniauxia mediterranea]
MGCGPGLYDLVRVSLAPLVMVIGLLSPTCVSRTNFLILQVFLHHLRVKEGYVSRGYRHSFFLTHSWVARGNPKVALDPVIICFENSTLPTGFSHFNGSCASYRICFYSCGPVNDIIFIVIIVGSSFPYPRTLNHLIEVESC